MNNAIYLIGQIIIILLVFGLLNSLLFGLRHALSKMHMKQEKRRMLQGYVTLGILIWLTILAVASVSGFFQNFEVLPPRMFIAFVPPVLITIWLMFSRLFGVILKAIPASWLVYIQSFRIIMELFLWMGFMGGYVPIQMTL